MADSPYPDEVSSLARDLTERISALCPHVPAGELASLTSRLALAEHAHATGVPFGDAEPESEPEPAALGNRIVWLPGSSTSAIVLPAGEEPAGAAATAAATAAQLLTWTREHATPVRGLVTRGSAALKQIGVAVVNAYQTRPRVQ